jgi:uncharacterized membrane protein YciS (DUF1049 family)
MDANQFQTFVVAWGTAITTLIAVLLAVGLAFKSAVTRLFNLHGQNTLAIAAVTATTAAHDTQLNGALDARIQASVDARIAQHRRPSDNPSPPAA